MGCKQSKPERASNGGSPRNRSESIAALPPEQQCNRLAEIASAAYWVHLTENAETACPENILQATWEAFVCTLVDTCAVHVRLSFEDAKREVLFGLERGAPDVPKKIREGIVIRARQVDYSISRLMDAWINATWPTVSATIPYARALEIARELAFTFHHCEADCVENRRDITLALLFDGLFWNIRSPEMATLFNKISGGAAEMSVPTLAQFYKGQGVPEFDETHAEDKVKARFGGHFTYRTFAAFFGNALLNSALDLQRSTNVWQDMTKPLPSYLIMTCTVETERDVTAALLHGARAIILNVYREKGCELCLSPGFTLDQCLTLINQKAFQHNPFPIVLSFNPECDFPIDVQSDVASKLVNVFKDRLPKGLMFEGATLNDPLFSPAALKEKVLVMAKQAPLKPFVGLFVADMQRENLGVRVTDVKESTPAAKAGIHKDDWLTHINNQPIGDKKNLKVQLSQLHLGDVCTVRKENLDEVKLVVGAAVNGGAAAANCSESLSDVVFLRIENERNGGYAPWETQTIEDGQNHPISPTSDHFVRVHSKKASKLQTFATPQRRISAGENGNASLVAGREATEDDISRYDVGGVQFVDVRIGRAAWLWAAGKFADNGHCGFLLAEPPSSPNSPTAPPTQISISLVVPPVRFASEPLTLFRGHILGHSVVQAETSDGKPKLDLFAPNRHGVVILEMQFGKHQFVAAMPAHLIRPGYHAVTLLDAAHGMESLDDDRSTVALCCVQRQ